MHDGGIIFLAGGSQGRTMRTVRRTYEPRMFWKLEGSVSWIFFKSQDLRGRIIAIRKYCTTMLDAGPMSFTVKILLAA